MSIKKISLTAILLMVPLSSVSAEATGKKATTIDELAQMYDVSSCKECHAQQFKEWEQSYHAQSLVGSPRTMATIASTIKDGLLKEYTYSGAKKVQDLTVEHMMVCAKCHLPQLRDATDAVAQEIAQAAIDGAGGDEKAKVKLGKLGINCLICHNSKAIIHKWTDGEIQADTIYGSKDGAHDDPRFSKLKASPTIPESIMCGQCHGLGPNFDLTEPTQCATLYGSYLHAYVPSGGDQSCQDCHMRQEGEGMGHAMQAYRNPQIRAKAVAMEVDARGYKFLPAAGDSVATALVTVKMTSKAGHRIPDG
jgi:Zn-finger protein